MNNGKETILQIATQNPAKGDAFREAMPHAMIYTVSAQYDEKYLASLLSPVTPLEWPVALSREKARVDTIAVGGMIGSLRQLAQAGYEGDITTFNGTILRIYTDTIQVVYGVDGATHILEKPHPNLLQWTQSQDALIQSGKKVELVTGITAVNMSDVNLTMHSVLVRVDAQMKPYSRRDLIHHLRTGGTSAVSSMRRAAGGLSLANGGREFYDDSYPLKVWGEVAFQPEGGIIFEDTVSNWGLFDSASLKPFVYGARKEAIDALIQMST